MGLMSGSTGSGMGVLLRRNNARMRASNSRGLKAWQIIISAHFESYDAINIFAAR